jgi:hypothetical protein
MPEKAEDVVAFKSILLKVSWSEKRGISGWETFQRTFGRTRSKNISPGKSLS